MVRGENLNYGRIFKDYKDELELALIQNSAVECELYSIIASVLRESESGREVSLRDVSARRTTQNSVYLKGEAGFPDFVVLKREKIKNAPILGCIEIKKPDVELKRTEQISGHINSYSKVIYTNGLMWQFFNKKELVIEISVGEYVVSEETIKWKSNTEWFKLLEQIDNFKWI